MDLLTEQSSSKRLKQEENEVDRLSALPDNLIHHILSFLPTNLSFPTILLARRWRFHWAEVPILDFNNNNVNMSAAKFLNMVHKLMQLHNVHNYLKTFRLSITNNSCDDVVERHLHSWISTAVARNVQNILLHVIVKLPRCLFTCKTLVYLSLDSCRAAIDGGGDDRCVYLPNLKTLCLYRMNYEANEALPRLLSGCPVLEELTIDRTTYCELISCLDISSPTIKRLAVNFPYHSHEFDEVGFKVKINAPALEYLKIDDCSYKHISVSPPTTKSLVEMEICMDTYLMHESFGYIHAVAKFLEEHACVYSLKTLRINQFGSTEHELGMVECVLKNHGSLERMEICPYRFGIGSKATTLRRVSQFHRGSKGCKLVVY